MPITFTQETRPERDHAIRRQLADWAAQQDTITPEALADAVAQALKDTEPDKEGVTLEYDGRRWALLGADVGTMADWLDTALLGLASLRAKQYPWADELVQADPKFWYWPINDLYHQMLPRLRGVEEAAIREHHATGGSLSHLATAMDVERSTAQYRRTQVIDNEPSSWERWARTGGVPQNAQDPYAARPAD